MSHRLASLLLALGLLAAPAARAQLVPQLPSLPQTGPIDRTLERTIDPVLGEVRQTTETLVQDRLDRLRKLARRHPREIALDREGNPVRAGEVVVEDADDALVAAAQAQGFALIERTRLDDLGVSFARFRAPGGGSIERALERMRRIAGRRSVSADPLHFASGEAETPAPSLEPAPPPAPMLQWGPRIGVIDGGIDPRAITGTVYSQGFAAGGPVADAHGTAVASLIRGGSGIRGAAPAATLFVADVYGRDPAGGSATAIAKALAWMVQQRVGVVTISLVGPANPLLARAIAGAQARGTVIVAAVGNDGPAAPPAYPASYDAVVAVTGVDARNRVLIEAGRASHLDYAAPGADMFAAGLGAKAWKVRGTSFAAPLVAARLALAYPAPDPGRVRSALSTLDREARDLGRAGPDADFGRGLLCGDCRTTKK